MEQESLTTRSKNLLNKDLMEVKLEPHDLHDTIVNISAQTEATSDSFELSQNIDKSCKNKTGKFC